MIKKEGYIYGIYYVPKMRFVYVGMTQRSVGARKRQHIHYLKNNTHYNHKLQSLFNKSKESEFKFISLNQDKLSRNELYDLEKYYVSYYNSFNNSDELSCNLTEGGSGNPAPNSLESIIKMKETKRQLFEQGLHGKTDGEINGMHVLKEDEVLKIVELLKSNKYTHSQIANMYNVSRSNIGAIANGDRWSYLDEVKEFAKTYSFTKPTVIPEDDLIKIKIYKEIHKLSNNEISSLTGYNYELIRKLPKRKKYQNLNIEGVILNEAN